MRQNLFFGAVCSRTFFRLSPTSPKFGSVEDVANQSALRILSFMRQVIASSNTSKKSQADLQGDDLIDILETFQNLPQVMFVFPDDDHDVCFQINEVTKTYVPTSKMAHAPYNPIAN